MPSDPIDPQMPFLLLNDGHLSRWRGNALLRLGNQDAINSLEAAARELDSSPRAAVRGQLSMYVDLAFAYAAAGDTRGAVEYARKARQLATRIGSDRQRQRLTTLVLPDVGRTGIA
jgi:tetratricopeptide (TPR) repeat protein